MCTNINIVFEVPFADVKEIKNGSVPIYYRITDRAGNTSGPKEYKNKASFVLALFYFPLNSCGVY